MAAFNQSDNNQAIVSTGLSNASRGVPADESMGLLFKGLGDALQNGLTAFDESTKVKIELAADAAVNGPGGAVESAMPGPDGKLPPGAEASLGNIANLKAALDQGTISQVQFDNGVAMHAKRIRASVPAGYGPMVERALSSAVGSSTANQARQTQMAAIDQAARTADAGYNKMRTWFEKEGNAELLYTPNVQAFVESRTGMKMPDIINNPTEQTFEIVREAVDRQKGAKAQMDLEIATINRNKAVSTYQGTILVDEAIQTGMNRDVNIPWGKFLDAKEAASDPNSPGGVEWTAEESAKIVPLWQTAKMGILTDVQKRMASVNVPGSDRDAMLKQATEQLQIFEDAMTSGQLGLMNVIKNKYASGKDELAAALWTNDSVTRRIQAMKDAGYPPEMINTIMQADKSFTNLQDRASAIEAALSGLLTNNANTGDVFGKVDEFIPKEQQGAFNKAWIDQLGNLLNQDVKNPKGIATAAKNLFDEQNDKLIASLPWEHRFNVFQRLMSPKVVSALVASGDVDAINAASRWGENQLRVISNKAQSNMIDGQKFRYGINITFDGQKFVATPRQSTAKEFAYNGTPSLPFGLPGDAKYTEDARQAVNDMNRYIGVMKPLWEAQNKDVATAMAFVMQENINNIKHEAPILQTLVEGVYNYLQGGNENTGMSPVSKAGASIPAGEKVATNAELTSQAETRAGGGAKITYANSGATRNRKVTPELEGKLTKAVSETLGPGYTVQVFSGGQPAKGSKGKRTGSIRHDDHGHGGQAADVYIIGPDGKKVTDTKVLDKLKQYWLKNDMGSVGTYMRGAGMHLDEWTKEELLAGMGQTWNY